MIVVIILIVAGLAVFFAATSMSSSTSTMSSISSSSSIYSSRSSVVSTTSSSVSVNQSQNIGTLTVEDTTWPSNDLNQLQAVNFIYPDWLMYSVYQPLVTLNISAEYNSGVFTYEPVLANSWNVSSDGRTYTFSLKQGVKFSNGDPFNAYQYWMELYGFYYLSANASTWMNNYQVFNMTGVNFGPATVTEINESGGLINPSQSALSIMDNSSWPIYATGPYTLVFHLVSPFVYFPAVFVALNGLIFDSQYVLDNGGFGTPTSVNSQFNQNPIPGTGPYVVTGVSEDNYVKLAQNPTYWGANLTASQIAANPLIDPGHASNVLLYYKPDDLSRYTDLSTGAAQLVAIEGADWNLVTSNPQKYSYFKLPPWAGMMSGLALNTKIFPTNITDVRQAIVHAINYTDIGVTVFHGDYTPFVGPNYPLFPDYYNPANLPPYSYNITLAKQYLQESNVTNLGTINMTAISSCSYCMETAQIVQSDLAQIGININIEGQLASNYYAPYASYASEAADPQAIAPISYYGHNMAPSEVTPIDQWAGFVSNESQFENYAIYYNPIVQNAINTFFTSTNTTLLKILITQAQQQVYDDAPYAWLGINGLPYVDGSYVWQNGVVKSFYLDPVWFGEDTAPIFNTVTFG